MLLIGVGLATAGVIKIVIGAQAEFTGESSLAKAEPGLAAADEATSTVDPLGGQFTLADAFAGMPDQNGIALIHTEFGTLSCVLFPERAPLTVANFVGLARGLRPFKQFEQWVKVPDV
jgi:peptidyl-prolyl cis-trans isomerase A (cyclophilin A)